MRAYIYCSCFSPTRKLEWPMWFCYQMSVLSTGVKMRGHVVRGLRETRPGGLCLDGHTARRAEPRHSPRKEWITATTCSLPTWDLGPIGSRVCVELQPNSIEAMGEQIWSVQSSLGVHPCSQSHFLSVLLTHISLSPLHRCFPLTPRLFVSACSPSRHLVSALCLRITWPWATPSCYFL
jgi:hypothetical protein